MVGKEENPRTTPLPFRSNGCSILYVTTYARKATQCAPNDAATMASRRPQSLLSKAADELGVFSILHSPRDTKLLCLQRFVRMFAYGASTLILALYLSTLGNSDERIGLFMTLTLLGDVVISFFLTLVADGLGRRNILIVGAVLMSASGVVFALSGNYWVLVAASIFGVISPRYDVGRSCSSKSKALR